MEIAHLETKLQELKEHIEHVENHTPTWLGNVNDAYVQSAQNLLRYLALRSWDIREIQAGLISFGISSLGTSPGFVKENISRSLGLLQLIQGKTPQTDLRKACFGFENSAELLQTRTKQLFGSTRGAARTKIMVTMPEETANDVALVEQFLKAGMDAARINLSHGNYHMWDTMLNSIIEAGDRLSKAPAIFMDLPGPKIRVDSIFSLTDSENEYKKVEFISVVKGEHLELMKESDFIELKSHIDFKRKIITVLLPQIIDDLQVGHRIFLDDGAIETVVISKSSSSAALKIIRATKKKLGFGKGINLPDTHLTLPSLTPYDLELLPYACKNADVIGYSFVRSGADVKVLYSNLLESKENSIGVVFKIETREAFENLPEILFEAMKRPRIGVMIARGDLAVEVGFERISEVKNQIMAICEAAHIPVIWATQVLENMAKKGLATRAEISDVILSGKTECVMLNKGPFMTDTIKTLKNILRRMDGHYNKNKSTLRALEVAKKTIEKMYMSKG